MAGPDVLVLGSDRVSYGSVTGMVSTPRQRDVTLQHPNVTGKHAMPQLKAAPHVLVE
ncbi:hypothetical protein [Rhodovastum atsumiense]|uniref:hypothetical protein n=1 Tax=Rhodovastum atsumiense TaxID=504468 RepID=UPI00139F2985|nr:hypothetical protein [Rhodovastum atsumiense]